MDVYTQAGLPRPSAVWTEEYWSPIIAVMYFIGLSMLSIMLSKRLPKRGEWRQTSPPKVAIVFVLLDSYAYVFTAALLTYGVGTSRNSTACGIGVWVCIGLYATTKIFITIFLIERIHIVHDGLVPRRRSRLYISNCILALGWIVCLIVFIIVKNHGDIRPSDGSCVYHLNHSATFGVAALDIAYDLYFGLIFAIPLYRGKWSNHRLRKIAVKSLIATIVTMACSVSNLLVIAILHGKELSWMCLALCGLDTLANAVVLFYITKTEGAAKPVMPAPVAVPPNYYMPAVSSFHERPFPSTILSQDPPFSNYANPAPHINPYFKRSPLATPQLNLPPCAQSATPEKDGNGHDFYDSPSSPIPGPYLQPLPEDDVAMEGSPSPRPRRKLRFFSSSPKPSPCLSMADNPASWRGDASPSPGSIASFQPKASFKG